MYRLRLTVSLVEILGGLMQQQYEKIHQKQKRNLKEVSLWFSSLLHCTRKMEVKILNCWNYFYFKTVFL